jgi:hypothetical protein
MFRGALDGAPHQRVLPRALCTCRRDELHEAFFECDLEAPDVPAAGLDCASSLNEGGDLREDRLRDEQSRCFFQCSFVIPRKPCIHTTTQLILHAQE